MKRDMASAFQPWRKTQTPDGPGQRWGIGAAANLRLEEIFSSGLSFAGAVFLCCISRTRFVAEVLS
jgi:hypothetical protein